MHIVVFGGSFDPVHLGHVAMADAAQSTVAPDLLLWLPAGHAPHKLESKPAAAEDRVALLQLVVQERQGEEISMLEVERTGPSFMVDSLLALRGLHPDARLSLLLGMDSLTHLLSWKAVSSLFQLCDFYFVPRPSFGEDFLKSFQNDLPTDLATHFSATYLPMTESPLSSTTVRARLEGGQSVSDALPPSVHKAVKARGLYSSSFSSEDDLRQGPQ